jgi:hypothetical protein
MAGVVWEAAVSTAAMERAARMAGLFLSIDEKPLVTAGD